MVNLDVPVTIFALTGIYALWTFGFRKQFLDNTRISLFQLRSTLFNLAADGKIDFNDPVYRQTEEYINNFIKYSHKVNLFRIFVRAKLYKNNTEAKGFAKNLIEGIDKFPDKQVSDKLKQIVNIAAFLVFKQAFFSNLITFFIFIFITTLFTPYVLFKVNLKKRTQEKKDKLNTKYRFERAFSKKFGHQINFLKEDAYCSFNSCNM